MNLKPYLIVPFLVLTIIGISGLTIVPQNISKVTLKTTTSDGVTISYNLYTPKNLAEPVPVVVIGHGINVNKEMMTNFAVELATQNYIVASLDWRGHGRSTGYLTTDGLYRDLEAVIADLPLHVPADTEQIALLGYSMGGFPTYKYAADHSTVKAWVGVGTTADGDISDRTNPQNVLMIIAKYDEAFSPEEAKEPMVDLTGVSLNDIEFEKLYGDITKGTARKVHIVPGADHLTTPWNSDFVYTATSWIVETFGGSYNSVTTFYPRAGFLVTGIIGLIGFLSMLSFVLAEKFDLKSRNFHLEGTLSVKAFVGRYYLVTFLFIPTVLLFVPLFLTPLPFTALLTTITGGLGVNLLVYCWFLAKREKRSLKAIVKSNVCQSLGIWLFSVIITVVFVGCYYFLIGKHFLGMVPSQPKVPYLVLYTGILFFVFFFYKLFIQKVSVPFLEKKVKVKNSGVKLMFMGIFNFVLIYSWFCVVTLVPCFVMDNYFFAMILILMIPIFLFLVFFSVYMERITGSLIPSAVLQAVWLGLVTTTLTPFVSGLAFMG